jgi:hypothetical protein
MRVAVDGQNREERILDHAIEVDPSWWSGQGIELSTVRPDSRIRRSDLFELGETATESDEALLNFVWHVLAWGTGTSARNNLRRIANCRTHAGLLREACAMAHDGHPDLAYGSLIRRGGAVVPWLGPAFFSKVLYFASEGAEARSLILDARVAQNLYALGWSIGESYPTTGATASTRFSFNWYTLTYVSYCELLQGWADQTNAQSGRTDVTPDLFERALFDR